MTALEKLRKEQPNRLYGDTPNTCPSTLGYLDDPDFCGEECCCFACWNREIPGIEEPIRLSRDDVTKLNEIIEKTFAEKENENMSGVKETQCTRCIHREVCDRKMRFLDAQRSIDNVITNSGELLKDIDWIKPIELSCKYFYKETNHR